MTLHVPVVLIVLLMVPADAPKGDAQKLQGTWTMVRGEEDGNPVPKDVARSARLTIDADWHTVRVGENTMVGTHKLEAKEKPKTIDVTDTEGPFKGQTLRGIYRIRGDEFTVCFAAPGKDRPSKFTTKSGTAHLLHVWKHRKD